MMKSNVQNIFQWDSHNTISHIEVNPRCSNIHESLSVRNKANFRAPVPYLSAARLHFSIGHDAILFYSDRRLKTKARCAGSTRTSTLFRNMRMNGGETCRKYEWKSSPCSHIHHICERVLCLAKSECCFDY